MQRIKVKFTIPGYSCIACLMDNNNAIEYCGKNKDTENCRITLKSRIDNAKSQLRLFN